MHSSYTEKLSEIIDKYSIVSKTNTQGMITYVNDMFCSISKYTKEELLGRNHNIVKSDKSDPAMFAQMWELISNGHEWEGIVCNKSKDGTEFYVHTIVFPVFDERQKISEYVAIRNNVTALINQNNFIERIVKFDSLTGLGNYLLLNDDIKSLGKKELFLAFIDINDFSDINATYGYKIGDILLKTVGKRLQKEFKDKATVYRKAGDVFAILRAKDEDNVFCNIESFEKGIAFAIDDVFKKSFALDGLDVLLVTSIGIAHGKQNSEVYKKAEIALSYAKQHKKKLSLFEDSMLQDIHQNFSSTKQTLQEIKSAIEEDRIVPFFQPILNNETKKIEKYECLARLVKKDGSIMHPGHFIDVSKKTKRYEEITRIMLKKCFAYFREKPFEFSVNINFLDITNVKTKELIIELLTNYPRPERVIFEILEDEDFVEYIANSDGFENFDTKDDDLLKIIKKMGAKIAIDDFGVGYSNFSRLIGMNVDFLKIDGSLIKQVEDGSATYSVVESLNSFAKCIKAKTVAEFVSTDETYKQVNKLHIDFSQGYFIGAPKPETICENSFCEIIEGA